MKNKILILGLSLVLILSLAACGDKEIKDNEVENKENVTSVETEVTSTEEYENKSETETEKIENKISGINDFNEENFLENCDFVHVIEESHETSKSDVVKGIQIQKLVYNVADEHKIFVNSDVNSNGSAGLLILRVGTNKVSDIKRLNVAEIVDLDSDLYTVNVFETPCCHYYVFKLKMPLTPDSISVGFGIDDYITYNDLKDIPEYKDGYSHIGDGLFCEGSIVDIKNDRFLITRNERELVKDISTEDERIALKQAVIELLPLNGTIKIDQLDSSKWFVKNLNAEDIFEYEDEAGGIFTYTITTVSPEYRNEYNNDLVHSVYITYKYINTNLTGDDLEKAMDKIIADSFVAYVDEANEYYRNFVIN